MIRLDLPSATVVASDNTLAGLRLGDDDGEVVTEAELLAAVDAAFVVTGRGLAPWPAPHPDRSPLDAEYSRVTDPGKWRIVGARADAWLHALTDNGLAVMDIDVPVQWRSPPGPVISRTDQAVPHAAGALPLVVARGRIEDIDDAGVTVGVGRPAICVAVIPFCGCDACDGGAQDELDQLDSRILSIVCGRFRRLTKDGRHIVVVGDAGWTASDLDPQDVPAILADPEGWDEVTSSSWL